jgi:prepilin-type processing-associated H-X9-DG protein
MLIGNAYGNFSGSDLTAQGIGRRWGDAHVCYTLFYTIMPPNSPSCGNGGPESEALITASSYHPGGVNVAMCDASVRFVSDNVNAGNQAISLADFSPDPDTNPIQHYAGPSPWGIWGAMGTRAGGEPIINQ